MADPVLDETVIIAQLKSPCSKDYVHIIQAGAVQALCDVYDRKVTRDEFTTAAAACLSLYGQAAKVWMLHNIEDVFKAANLNQAAFDDADQRMTELMRKHCEVVIELVKRLTECPTSQDKLN